MALSILDGNQSATTLSTIVTSGQHIPAHTVVSIGTQAITDISGAISGSTVCVGNLGLLQSTVATEGLSASGSFIKIGGHTGTSTTGNIVHVSAVGALRVDGSVYTQPVSIASVTVGNTVNFLSGSDNDANLIENIAGAMSQNNILGITNALPAGTNRIGVVTIGAGTVTLGAGTAQIGSVTASISNSVTIASLPAISGTVTASNVINGLDSFASVTGNLVVGAGHSGAVRIVGFDPSNSSSLNLEEGGGIPIFSAGNLNLPISGTVTVGNTVAISGTVTASPTGTQTIAGTVTANASFASTTATYPSQIVAIGYKDEANTGNILAVNNDGDGGLPVFLRNISVEGAQSTQLPSWLNGQESNNVPISGTVTANTFALQGTAVTTSNFTSTTASTLLANYNATREVLTIFNEGAGNLHICAGATCTTIAYQVRLSAGDYYEVPNHQTTITHSAVFATAGTARVTQVS